MTAQAANPHAKIKRPSRFRLQASAEHFKNFKNRLAASPDYFVFGNQKSGTSLLAAALAEVCDTAFTNDLALERYSPTYRHLHPSDSNYLETVINRSRHRFASGVFKEPSLTFFWEDLLARFSDAKAIFVVRNPFDNIRSCLDRMGFLVNGELISTPVEIPYPWTHLVNMRDNPNAPDYETELTLDVLIHKLALRWQEMAKCALKAWGKGTPFIRYELFLQEPHVLMNQLGLEGNIKKAFDTFHQKPGANRHVDARFVLKQYEEDILDIVAFESKHLGYEL